MKPALRGARAPKAPPATVLLAALAVFGAATPAAATPTAPVERADAEAPRAVFALIIGVNASLDPNVAPLRYADDDAARYQDLFRALGARTYVLARMDANTRRLHPQAAAEALPPRQSELGQVVQWLARDIGQARARGVASTLYVVYAGHGDVQGDDWLLTLEDDRLTGTALLSSVIERAGAEQSHVIVDACHAYLLALPRGPGGTRRSVQGFVEREAATRAGHVGYLLSSSLSGESHEWAGFEAGVFSHEVRSGLYGAADADGDGRVTYAEIGAFVARANVSIVNDRFRPKVLARAPRAGLAGGARDVLLDLRGRSDHQMRLRDSEAGAHYLLENADGVRLLDFHGTGVAPIHLLRPVGDRPLYLRRVNDGVERVVPRLDGPIELAALPPEPPRSQTRGAAHEAFSQIFSRGFDDSVVRVWVEEQVDLRARWAAAGADRERETSRARWRTIGGGAVLVAGAGALAAAVAFGASARALERDAPRDESHLETVARNQRIESANRATLGWALGGALAAGTGALLLLWPRRPVTVPELDVALSAPGESSTTLLTGRWRY